MESIAPLESLASLLQAGGKAAALTGAGMSTESGIPDFRSAGGIWDQFDPMEYAHIAAFRSDPEKVWQMLTELESIVLQARPNDGHRALAALERAGMLLGVITQNIDGLHQAGGSTTVVEFHGSGRTLVCLRCGARADAVSMRQQPRPPRCPSCQSIMKPDAVLFGEDIGADALRRANALVEACDVMLVCGTSTEVWPAAQLPQRARQRGALVYEFNLEACLPAPCVSERVLGPLGVTLPALVAEAGAT